MPGCWFLRWRFHCDGLLFGIVPALRTAKLDLRETLNESSRGSTAGPGHHRVRGLLVITEIALAMLLLAGSGLLLRSFSRLQETPPGFSPDHLLVADVPLSQVAYAKPEQRYEFFDRLVEHVRQLPGVTAADAASFLPVSGGGSIIHFNIAGRAPNSPHDYVAAGYRTITPGYLQTLKVPLLQGGGSRRRTTRRPRRWSLLMRRWRRRIFQTKIRWETDPTGATPEPASEVPMMEIVGVVDVRPGLGVDPQTEMYLPYRQADAVLPVFQLSVVLRTVQDPQLETSALRSALKEIDPNQPLVQVRTMEENISANVAQPRFRTWLLDCLRRWRWCWRRWGFTE